MATPVQFTGLRQTWGSGNFLQSSALADMTQDGVVAGHSTPLSRTLSDITKDPAGSYYGTVSQDVYRINPTNFQFTLLPITGVGVDTGWPIGCTFDTLRNRLIVATLSGPGYMFAYSPQTQQWSLLSNFNQEDFQSIVYRPTNDTLYTLPNVSGPTPMDRLFKYGPNGQLLGTLQLQYALPQAEFGGDGNYQLMVTSDPSLLAVLTPKLTDSHDPSHPLRERLYLINADTGAIAYNSVFPAPEPSAAMISAIFALTAACRSRRCAVRPKRCRRKCAAAPASPSPA
jgi:hypothetical protein